MAWPRRWSERDAPPPRRRLLRWAIRAGLFLLALASLAVAAAWWTLRASLAVLEGELPLAGLSAPVSLERDALGVPVVKGRTRLDVARATGFVHAQERLFQMDLLRRGSAGELAELLGPAALPLDRAQRPHRLRAVAEASLALAPPEERALVAAYAEGVNAGRAALGARPFEYLLLGAEPKPWSPLDSFLVGLSLFSELAGDVGAYESAIGRVHDAFPPALAAFLTPLGTSWDAPLEGGAWPEEALPGGGVHSTRRQGVEDGAAGPPDPGTMTGGDAPAADARPQADSNAFAVAGWRSGHGGALVACDMHLRHALPNIWYRASLAWGEGQRVTGVMLPGTPLVVAGSTGRIAWGFTNSYGDLQDLVLLEEDPDDPERYRVPEGWARLEHPVEVLRARGAPPERLVLEVSRHGPVLGRDHAGRRRALRWTAHDPRAVNLGLSRLERAATVEEALAAGKVSGIPPQNLVVADHRGHIGWTVAGALPKRVGFDGRVPESWADGARRWEGLRAPEEVPEVIDPPSGRIVTANARLVKGRSLEVIGDGGYWLGARAKQLDDGVAALERPVERDLLAVQLDDRALFLERWRALLLRVLRRTGNEGGRTGNVGGPGPLARRFAEAAVLVEGWGGRAAPGSAGYLLVRTFRLAVHARALAPFSGERPREPGLFGLSYLTQAEGPVWRLVEERPPHLLAPAFESWEALLASAAAEAIAACGERPLRECTWGTAGPVTIRHPLSAGSPALARLLGRLLDLPPEALPGDVHMPRFQAATAGASQRMVVSPGREGQGIFHMPGGQSGHPLSPHYRAGHRAWAEGTPTPFLPGPAEHTLRLTPPPASDPG